MVVYVAVVAGVIGYQLILVAGYKPFWFDEGLGDLVSCAQPYSSILTKGATLQCSPAPLYYLIQKVVITHVPTSDNIIYSYRAISLVSAVLTLVVLFFGFSRNLGLAWGLLAILVIIMPNYGRIYRWGAEDRPYMLWVFFFTVTLVIVAFLFSKSWREVGVVSKTVLTLLLICLTLVAGGGVVQAFGFLLCLSLWQESLNVGKWFRHPAFKYQLPIAIVCGAIGTYYALHGCGQWNTYDLDLLRTRNWSLVRGVLLLLWPQMGGSCSNYNHLDPCGSGTILLNIFVLTGASVPFLLWRKRREISGDKQFLLAISAVSVVQLVCAVALGILVAVAHYYFIPRIFLYLITLRAVLAVCGGYFLVTYLVEKGNETFTRAGQSRYLHVVVLIGIILNLSGWLYVNQRTFKSESRLGTGLALVDTECPPTDAAIALMDTPTDFVEMKLNFIVSFGEHLKRCDWKPIAHSLVYVVPQYSSDGKKYSFRITDKLPPHISVLSVFGRPLFSTP